MRRLLIAIFSLGSLAACQPASITSSVPFGWVSFRVACAGTYVFADSAASAALGTSVLAAGASTIQYRVPSGARTFMDTNMESGRSQAFRVIVTDDSHYAVQIPCQDQP